MSREISKDELLWGRLARTPYFVLPKLALAAMPDEWCERFEQLMVEMEDRGLETPVYNVFRDGPREDPYAMSQCVNWETGFVKIRGGRRKDPWANYKYGDVTQLCEFVGTPGQPLTESEKAAIAANDE